MAKQALSAHHAQQKPVSSSTTAKAKEEAENWADGKGKGKKKGRAKNKGRGELSDQTSDFQICVDVGAASRQPDPQGGNSELMSNCPTKSSLRMHFVCYFHGMGEAENVPETLSEGFLAEAVDIYKRAIEVIRNDCVFALCLSTGGDKAEIN